MNGMSLDVMLCDHAQVEGGKLFISGANIDRMAAQSGPPYFLNFAAAGLVRVPWTETNVEHVLSFGLLTEDGADPPLPEVEGESGSVGGEMRFNVGRPAQLSSGDDQMVPFAFNFQGLPIMQPGRYGLQFAIDGHEARRLTFTLTVGQPQGLGG
jgi:hypothetical protein